MPGLLDGAIFEIEFTPSTWTDVTAYVAAEEKVGGRFGRATEFEDVGPATFAVTLRNDDGRFTPDSPGSPYYPNVIEGRRLRATLIKSSTHYPLFTGPILSWEPDYSAGALGLSTVTVSASDSLATLALHTFDSRWIEETRALARAASTWADVWVPTGDATTTAWNNIGVSIGAAYGTARLVAATAAVGEVSYSTPSSLTLEASAEFKPSDEVGKALDVVPAAAPSAVSFWLQVPADTLPTTTVYVLRPLAGAVELLSIRLVNNAGVCDLVAYASGGVVLGTLAAGVADAAWRRISVTTAGADTLISATTTTGGVTSVTVPGSDLTTCTRLVVAGATYTGNGSGAASMLLAGLSAAGAASVVPAYQRALPGQSYTHPDIYAAFRTYVPEVIAWATTGSEVRVVGEPDWAGKTALDVLQTIARTINGVTFVDGSGSVTLAAADVVRPAVSAATLGIESDLDVGAAVPTLRRASDSRPTRVTIDYAAGATTLVDTVAEANNQPRREVKIDTCAADVAGAVFAGSYVLQAANGLRITQVAVDLVTAQTDLWSTFLGLYPTQRITLAGFDPALIGASTMVVYVQGWKVDVDQGSVTYTLDCSPASQFPGAAWDAVDEYGRWSGDGMTVTSGTAIGTTANGTLAISWGTGGVGLSLNAADYPIYLDWASERVRIDTPPVGSTSPQTVTTAERGAYPTAARSTHTPSEAVDVWHAAIWAF